MAWLDITAQAEHGKVYAELDKATQANLRERMAEARARVELALARLPAEFPG